MCDAIWQYLVGATVVVAVTVCCVVWRLRPPNVDVMDLGSVGIMPTPDRRVSEYEMRSVALIPERRQAR